MALFYAYRTTGLTKDVTIKDGDGDAIVPGDNDIIKAIISRHQTAQLTITSEAATANGSSFTKNSPSSGKNRLRIDAQDIADIEDGVYTLLLVIVDNADSEEPKVIDRQIIAIEAGH